MHRFCRLAFRRSRWSLAFVWVGIFFAVSIPSAYSAQWEATVVPSKKRIKGYRIITNRTRVRTKGVDENRQAFVRIRGYFKRRGWGVYRNRKWILPKDSKKRSFSFRVPVKGELTEVNLRLVSPRNKARRTRILIELSLIHI